MSLLNKGLRLIPGQTQIQLNNRLFETPVGSAVVTLRPDAPKGDGTGDTQEIPILDPGSDTSGYLRVSIKHLDVGMPAARYRFVITTLGATLDDHQPLETTDIAYGEEVTLGLSWNAHDGDKGTVSIAVARADQIHSAATTREVETFNHEDIQPTSSGLGSNTTVDAPATIHGTEYAGFFNKLATYNVAMKNSDLQNYVLDPANLPTEGRVVFLDATQLVNASKIDNSLAEIQSLSFGTAPRSGVITVAGITTAVLRGDSGAIIAEKVRASLVANNLFKQQLTKQEITFGEGDFDSGEILIGGERIPIVNSGSTIASQVKSELESATAFTGRLIQENSDGSLLITFKPSDGDIKPLSVDSLGTRLHIGVDVVQRFNASGPGPKLTVNGNRLDIQFSPSDWDPIDLDTNPGGTGVTINKLSSAPDHYYETRSFTPSQFSFMGTPVGEVVRLIVTKGAQSDSSVEISERDGTPRSFDLSGLNDELSSEQTAEKIAQAIKDFFGLDDRVIGIDTLDDTVEIRFSPSAKNLWRDMSIEPIGDFEYIDQVVQRYAQNLQGESQTITFTRSGTSDASIVVGDIAVTVPAVSPGATTPSVAAAVQKALIEDGTDGSGLYSTPEVQMLTVLQAGSGTLTVTGLPTDSSVAGSVTVDGGLSTDLVAGEMAIELNAINGRKFTALADGDAVWVVFDNSVGSTPPVLTATVSSGSTLLTSGFSVAQEYSASGIRSTRVNADGSLTIDYNPSEGDVPPVILSDGSNISASVATTREAHQTSVTSSVYSGGVVSPSTAPPSNVLYTQLTSTDSGTDNKSNKKVNFNVFVDKAALSKSTVIGTGYEAVDFTLKFSTADFNSRTLVVTPMTSSAATPIINSTKPGEVVVRWLDTQSITDFSRPILTVSLDQIKAEDGFNRSPTFTFEKVGIDGVDFTDGTTYARSFSDSMNTDLWDIRQKLVNGLDGVTGVGGQLVGYYGAPSGGGQISLKFNSIKDAGGSLPTLSASKQVLLDVANVEQIGVKGFKFGIELPANASAATFSLPANSPFKFASTNGQLLQGRTLYVNLELSSGTTATLARDALIGTTTIDLSSAFDRTHEFGFANGSVSYTNSSGTVINSSGNGLYFGYTQTDNTTPALRGTWMAKDMPRGEFNRFFIDTAQVNPSKVINSLDAIQILKLSANWPTGLDWRQNQPPTVGALAAADVDGNGKVQALDALLALRIATGTFTGADPVKWKFYDGASVGLDDDNAKLQALKIGMPVTTSNDIMDIPTNSDFFARAILVGNLTNPALEV